VPTLINHRALKRSVAALLLAAGLAGCSGKGGASPVEPAKAREALATALEAWKKGEAIGSLQAGSPSITAQDFDWMAGAKLVAYEVDGEGKENDLNLRVPVKLTLKSLQGKEVKKAVTYVIGTSPVVTVFREVP
jgi:hypothetical protein